MQAAGLYLPSNMQANIFEMSSHALSVKFSNSYGNSFGDLFRDEGANPGQGQPNSRGLSWGEATAAGQGRPSSSGLFLREDVKMERDHPSGSGLQGQSNPVLAAGRGVTNGAKNSCRPKQKQGGRAGWGSRPKGQYPPNSSI